MDKSTTAVDMVYHHQAVVDSTNDWAKRHWLEHGPQLVTPQCFIAGTQTQGRGTQGRSWISPPGGFYATLLLPHTAHIRSHVADPSKVTSRLTRLTGQWCQQWLLETFSLPVTVRGVNDLLVSGQKLGGLLVEGIWQGDDLHVILIGVGMNVVAVHPAQITDNRNTPTGLSDWLAGKDTAALLTMLAQGLMPFLVSQYRQAHVQQGVQ